MKLETIAESSHDELLSLINPLIDFMSKNGYSYFFTAGKDGTCTRHLRGDYDDVEGMIAGMMVKNKQAALMLKSIVEDFNNSLA